MRYRFTLQPRLRNTAIWTLEHYHEDKRQMEDYKKQFIPSGTAPYSPTGGINAGEPGRPTENAALKIASSPYLRTMEWNIAAVERALDKLDEIDLNIIDMVYWKKSHTVEGAGMKVGLSRRAAYDHINNILCRVALEMGLVNI